jgi:AcrR family transcriptional regulator
MATTGEGAARHTDGRSVRWAAHRAARREELVAAAAHAIAEHGPDLHLGEIAAAAGVSKPVLYRYFSDKDELLVATTRWVADRIVTAVTDVLRTPDIAPRDAVARAVGAYLAEVELHRNVFLLAVRHHTRGLDGSVADGKSAAADVLTRTLERALGAAGADTRGAEPWAHGVVGVSMSVAEWWLERGTVGRDVVAEHLTAFIWHAFDGLSREYGLRGPENVTQS